ncbi:hypothetical protein Q8A67_016007 [Cirrhinus molitorella]|uniref:Uncharacterized protein n=1 Tax=Cirrhinus molitorella TaxID=172907 RepID=A0AA88TJC9_9TELE|nr:hypothetical protein Q8A67_016007 [Cirrhinus molitorella]
MKKLETDRPRAEEDMEWVSQTTKRLRVEGKDWKNGKLETRQQRQTTCCLDCLRCDACSDHQLVVRQWNREYTANIRRDSTGISTSPGDTAPANRVTDVELQHLLMD